MGERKTLTERQLEFCRLCAVGTEPKEAAKQLGYRNVSRTVRDMLLMEKIRQEIDRQQAVEASVGMQEAEDTARPGSVQRGAAVKQVQRGRKKAEQTAEKEEILCFLTEVMRDEDMADVKTRMKAAELLGKRESLFEKNNGKDEKCRVVIVDDIS